MSLKVPSETFSSEYNLTRGSLEGKFCPLIKQILLGFRPDFCVFLFGLPMEEFRNGNEKLTSLYYHSEFYFILCSTGNFGIRPFLSAFLQQI
jgi:hypothetical protein